MPKILFTADLHIKLGQKNVPIDWAKNRFNLFLEQLSILQEKVDLVVVGGDIFDRFPDSADEIKLYYDLVSIFNKPTIFYDGNHEAIKKNVSFLTALGDSTQAVNSNVRIVTDFEQISLHNCTIDIIPYNKLKNKYPEHLNSRILCTHVRGEIPPHVKPEIDLDLLDRWDVVLAGDLHNYENCQRNILYPGSPYTTSFHRNTVDTGVIVLDTDTLVHEWVKLKLPQLLKYTVGVNDDKPSGDFHHIMYEVEGNLKDLSRLGDNPLIAKVLTERVSDAALILSKEMAIADELKEYLRYVLQEPEESIDNIIKEYLDNEAKLSDIL